VRRATKTASCSKVRRSGFQAINRDLLKSPLHQQIENGFQQVVLDLSGGI
jgi:hypothetical protein